MSVAVVAPGAAISSCRSWGFGCAGAMEVGWPERHAKACFQSGQGQQIGIGLSGKCSHQRLSADRASTCSLVDGQALLIDGGSEPHGDPARVFGRDRSGHRAVRPLTRLQVVDGPLYGVDSSRHHHSVLGCLRLRGHVCQVTNRSSRTPGSEITGMWFV